MSSPARAAGGTDGAWDAAQEALRLAVGAVDEEGLAAAAACCPSDGNAQLIAYALWTVPPREERASLMEIIVAFREGGAVEALRVAAPAAAACMSSHERQRAREDLAALVEQRRAGRPASET